MKKQSQRPIAILLLLLALRPASALADAPVSAPAEGSLLFETWSPGILDIHHLATGQGNATFFVLPDGTTLLVDAGDIAGRIPSAEPVPDAGHTAGERIAAYVRQVSPRPALDYLLLTHFHSDHMGFLSDESPRGEGGYALSGITEVAEHLPITTFLDRGWPEYDDPLPLDQPWVEEYRRFLEWQRKHRGLQVERFQAGRADQIVLRRDPDAYPSFEIRNLAVNGEVWTGEGQEVEKRFPPIEGIPAEDLPTENQSSTAFRLSYGAFDYFTGGDLPGQPDDGTPPWHDLETSLAPIVGPVEVHVVNHHGSIDPANAVFLSALEPRIHIVPAWAPSHPAPVVLKRLLNERIYPGPREVFTTLLRPETKAVLGRRGNAFASDHGHVLVRVAPGGGSYRIFVLEAVDGPLALREVHGPYAAR